ncbi:MAG: hypothetical protein KIS61_19820 [Candidatus Eremiobacteraeota bacterium]|nr:hypothetical protein [Candidatus Eremiobacteraeota bacterium]
MTNGLSNSIFRSTTFQTSMLWLSLCLACLAEPLTKPIYADWDLVPLSDVVARAKLRVPIGALKENLSAKKKYARIQLKVEIEEPIKGHFPSQPVLVGYKTEPPEYPLASFLEDHNDDEVILFLTELAGEYRFVSDKPGAVVPFSSEDFSKIVDEAKNQEEIVQHFNELAVGRPTEADAEIRKLFEGLTKKPTQAVAWAGILKLTRKDVPAIVRVMDDPRQVPFFDAYLPNRAPDAIEKYRHEGPSSIREAASIILEYITGASFRDVDGWRVWSVYNSG